MDTVGKTYQDGTYAAYNPDFGDDSAGWKVANAVKAIERFDIPHASIAEVGCGAGAIIRGVSTALNCQRAVGYEPMPEAYAVARQRVSDRLSFVNQTIADSTSDNFDLVLNFDVFEHVEDPFQFIRRLGQLSNRFLFHIPLDMSVQMVARMKPIMMVREQVGHIHYYSKETALATLADCGLKVQGHFYTFGGDASYSSWKYRLMKLPRKLAFAINQDLAVRFAGGYSLMVYATREQDTGSNKVEPV